MSVTVGELIEGLQALDPKLLVVLSSDGEGNTYRPLDESMSLGDYDSDEEYVYADAGEDDEAPEDLQPALVLWPAY